MNNVMTIISVFGASSTPHDSAEWHEAERLGNLLAKAGYAVATGGYGGSMEAVSKGVSEANGEVIGVTAPDVFKSRAGANPFVTEEVKAPHLLERIHLLTQMSSAAVALPGSLGTLTEIMVAWNLAYVAPFAELEAKPLIVIGEKWARVIYSLADELETGLDLIHSVETVEAALELLTEIKPQRADMR